MRDAGLAVFLALLCVIMWGDIATRIIPNRYCIVLITTAGALRLADGPLALLASLGTACVLFLVLAGLHAKGILGGGDVKLAASIAVALPLTGLMMFVEWTALSGGVLALVYLLLRQMPPPIHCPAGTPLARRVLAVERWRIRRHGTLPYGVAIAGGGAYALLTSLGS